MQPGDVKETYADIEATTRDFGYSSDDADQRWNPALHRVVSRISRTVEHGVMGLEEPGTRIESIT